MVFRVVFLLQFRHRHVNVVVNPLRQLVEHLILVPADEDRFERLADAIKVLIADHLAHFVVNLMFVQQLEGRAEPITVHELHDGDQLFQPVFQRGAGEDDGVGRGDALDATGDARVPVLDALGLVEDDQVGIPGLDQIEVAMDRVVVGDFEEGVGAEA